MLKLNIGSHRYTLYILEIEYLGPRHNVFTFPIFFPIWNEKGDKIKK